METNDLYHQAKQLLDENSLLLNQLNSVREETSFYKSILENSKDLHFYYTIIPERKFKFVSEAATSITGYTPEDHYADPDLGFKIVHPDDRVKLAEVFENETQTELTLRWIKKDQTTIWTKLRLHFIKDNESNKVIAIQGVAADITTEKEAEQELIQNQLNYHAVLDNLFESITVVTADGTLLFYNKQSAATITGMENPPAIKGSNLKDYLKPATYKQLISIYQKVIESQIPVNQEIAVELKQGKRYFQNSMQPILFNQQKAVLSFSVDITARKENEKAVIESEKRYKQLIESTSEGFWLIGPDKITREVNEALCRMTGFEKNDFIGFSPLKFFDEENQKILIYEMANISASEHRIYEISITCKDGTQRPVLSNATTIKDANGNLLGAFSMVQDISALKKNELALKESEAQLLSVLESINSAVWSVDTNFNILTINNIFRNDFEKYYGKKLEKGDKITSWVQDKEREKWIKRYEKALKGEPIIEIDTYELENKKHFLENRIHPILNGSEITGVSVIASDITNSKLAEEKLSESERFAQAIANNTPALVYLYDLESQKNIWTNSAHKEYFSQLEEASASLDINDITRLTHPEDFDLLIKKMDLLLTNRSNSIQVEIRLRSKTGWTWMNAVVTVFKKDENGNPKQVLGALFDISKIKSAEQALIQSNTNFLTLFDSIDDFLFILDENKNILAANKTVTERLAYPFEKLNQQSIAMVFDKEAHQNLLSEIDLLGQESESSLAMTLLSANGKTIYVETALNKGNWNQQPAYFLVCKDISALKRSEDKFATLFKTSPAITGLTDMEDGKYIEVNQAFCDILGFRKEEVIGKRAEDLLKMDGIFRKRALEILRTTGRLRNEETILYGKDNKAVHVLISAEIITLIDKQYNFTTAIDISTQKQTEQQLRIAKQKAEESDRKMRSMIENTKSGIIFCDTKGQIQEINQAALQMLGSPSQESSLEINVLTFNHLIEAGFSQNFKKCLTDKIVVTDSVHYTSVFNKTAFIQYFLVPVIVNEKLIGIWANLNDLTELWQSQKSLEAAKEKAEKSEKAIQQQNEILERNNLFISTVLDNLPIGLSMNSIDTGELQYMNIMFEKIYGWTKEEIKSVQDFFEKVYPDPDYRSTIAKQIMDDIASGDKNRMHWEQIEITQRTGKKRIVNAVNIPFESDNTMISTVMDFTDLYHTQNELIKAKEKAEESDKLKSAFLANMSHEIRTPMNGILGFAELLNEPNLSGEDQKQYIKVIEKSGHRMLNIINDIIDISKIESGLVETYSSTFSIREMLQEMYNFFKPEAVHKKLNLIDSFNQHPDLMLHTDKEKLEAILTNLIKNAIKYSPKGSVTIGIKQEQHHLNIYVADTGIGIPKNRQQAIFDRFVQADISDKMAFQGAGLGLSISKAYAEILGGEISVESETDKGSIFTLKLPVELISGTSYTIDNEAEEPQNIPLNSQRKLTILLAEDEPTSALVTTKSLKSIIDTIYHAQNGNEAIELFREHPEIDLILMDIKMPQLDGHKTTQAIREFNKDVIIIAQTAYALAGDRQKALDSGCNDYISKPIKKDDLIKLIQKYF